MFAVGLMAVAGRLDRMRGSGVGTISRSMMVAVAVLFYVALPAIIPVDATLCTWVGAASDSFWRSPANWVNCGGSFPAGVDIARINQPTTVRLTGALLSLYDLELGGGATLEIGTLQLSSGTVGIRLLDNTTCNIVQVATTSSLTVACLNTNCIDVSSGGKLNITIRGAFTANKSPTGLLGTLILTSAGPSVLITPGALAFGALIGSLVLDGGTSGNSLTYRAPSGSAMTFRKLYTLGYVIIDSSTYQIAATANTNRAHHSAGCLIFLLLCVCGCVWHSDDKLRFSASEYVCRGWAYGYQCKSGD